MNAGCAGISRGPGYGTLLLYSRPQLFELAF